MFHKLFATVRKTAAAVLILCFALCAAIVPTALAEENDSFIPEGAIPVDEYILVSMEHEYSFPDEDYAPSYFNAEYVKEVEAIFFYQEGDLVNVETFMRIEKLYLTDKGKAHIDELIEALNARDDIACAERDYLFPNVSADAAENTASAEEFWYHVDLADGAAYFFSQSSAWKYVTESFGIDDGEVAFFGADGTRRTDGAALKNGDTLCVMQGGETKYSAPVVLLLDPDSDGRVTSADARNTLRAAAKMTELDGASLLAANADGVGRVGADDARLILRVAARLEKQIAVWTEFTNLKLMDKIVMLSVYTDQKQEIETPEALISEMEKGDLSPEDRALLEKSFRRVTTSMAADPEVVASNTNAPVEAVPFSTIVIVELNMDARKDIDRIIGVLNRSDRVEFAEKNSAGYVDDLF
ncbi:MAG: hypothetical protein IJK23_15085 [Clostridia bacterium]|nr:hypothetical protein [Clostridia bacterium]